MDFSRPDTMLTPGDMELLSAYVDGELDHKAEAEVEQRLQGDPLAQSLVAQYRCLDRLIHQSLDPLPDETNQRCANARQARWRV